MVKKDEEYSDLSTVETQRTFLTSEEFPEGPFGSVLDQEELVENKSTEWKHGQQFYSNFTYENRNLHEDLPRQYPGAHPTHDDKEKDREEPYQNA